MTEVKEGPIVSHADAINREEDDREERAANNFEALTGSTPDVAKPQTAPKAPEKSMFTQEEADKVNEGLEWWEK